jgi:hypothetical protein
MSYQPPQPHRQTVKRGANHGLHLTLTICTCGIWAITGWPIAAAMGRKKTITTYTQPPQAYPPQQPYGQQPPNQWQPPQQ